jgi:hypothetical protein
VIGKKNAHNIDRSVMVIFFLCLYLAFVIMFGLKLGTWDDNIPGRCYYADGISMPNSLHPLGDGLYLAITSLYFFSSMAACGMVAINTSPQLQRFLALEHLIPNLDTQMTSLSIFELMSGAISDAIDFIYAGKLSSRELFRSIVQRFRKFIAVSLHEGSPKFTILMLAMLQYPLHIYMIFALRAANDHLLKGDSENYWGFGQVVALVLLASSVLQGFRAILGNYSWASCCVYFY